MNETITAPETKRTTLYYREGSSDKVYQASIEPQGDLFLVNFAFGRRGSTLNTGTKTSAPVDHDTATSIFARLVNEQRAKGYTEGPYGTPYQHNRITASCTNSEIHSRASVRSSFEPPTNSYLPSSVLISFASP